MGFFGDLERFLASLYSYRVPLTVGVLALLGGVAWAAGRRGWHGPLWRIVAAHRAASAVGAVLLVATAIPLGDYLLSPLWERTALIEASPLEVAAQAQPGGSVAAAPSAGPPAGPAAEIATPATAAAMLPRLVTRGAFAGADDFHFGRGDALLIEAGPRRYTLRVENFSVRNGPDLFVYLSDDPKGYGGTVLKLGRLRATDGSFNYEVPEGTDVSRFRSAIVWCEQFSVLFAAAPLR